MLRHQAKYTDKIIEKKIVQQNESEVSAQSVELQEMESELKALRKKFFYLEDKEAE